MAGRLLTGKIDVSKIDKSKIFEGKKGKYIDVSIWINEEKDQFGNCASVQQYMGKDAPKNYIGNLKDFEQNQSVPNSTPVPEGGTPDDDLPF